MECIASDRSQKTTLKGVQWNSLFTVFWVWNIGAHVEYAKTRVQATSRLKNWARSAIAGELLSCSREVQCECYTWPRVTLWVLPSHQDETGQSLHSSRGSQIGVSTAIWSQQGGRSVATRLILHSLALGLGPKQWDGGVRPRAFPPPAFSPCIPPKQWLISPPLPSCSCHNACKPPMGRRASLLFCWLCTGDCKWALNAYLIVYFGIYFLLLRAQKKRLKVGYDWNDALGQSPFILLP